MHPSRYANEHFSIPLAVGVLNHSTNLFHLALATSSVPFLALNPVLLRDKSSGRSESDRAGPSKSIGDRKVICLRTRSPVPGRIKVPFFSLCN